LQVLVSVGLQFWMYATPVIYSTAIIPERYAKFFVLNPVAPPVVLFKNLFFGTDGTWVSYLPASFIISAFFLLVGIISFNAAERTFLDTI